MSTRSRFETGGPALLPLRRRTKIVCTIGPATNSERMLERLVRAGMDCARLNFSHGKPEEHLRVINALRKIGRETGRDIAILQDLPGPKFRVGKIQGGSVNIKKNSIVALTTRKDDARGGAIRIPLRAQRLPSFVKKGGLIFLSDGSIRLKITNVSDEEITCKCEIGGTLLSGKGVNVPELRQEGFQSFTAADKKFLAFGLDHGVDLVAVSFVMRASDVQAVKAFARRRGSSVSVFAKIEKREAVRNIEEIIKVSDGLMVARGDLGVENPIEEIPELQKKIISHCNAEGIPVITATQMLESMVNNPGPTRAEVTDVANAIFDGTDAVMLSEESAIGKYPLECVSTLNKVSLRAEQHLERNWEARRDYLREISSSKEVVDAATRAAVLTSEAIDAKAILLDLSKLRTVSKISRFRPRAKIYSISRNQDTLHRSRIIWGVYPLELSKSRSTDNRLELSTARSVFREMQLKSRDRIVLVNDGAGSRDDFEELTIRAIELK